MVYRVGYKPTGLYEYKRARVNARNFDELAQALKQLRGVTYETVFYIHEGIKPYQLVWVGSLWQLENGERV